MTDLKIGCQYKRVQTSVGGLRFPQPEPVTVWAFDGKGNCLITWWNHTIGGVDVAQWVPCDDIEELGEVVPVIRHD